MLSVTPQFTDALNLTHGISDLADAYPAAEVTGIDLSPIQPEFLPPNCKFEIDDCCLDWTFPLNHFDLIHIRCLYGSVADWPRLYKEVYKYVVSTSMQSPNR